MAWDANWVGVYVQAAATVIAAVAAGLACWTTKTAKDISERQTALGAIQDLAKDYSGPEMFDALRRFGTLVRGDPDHRARFDRITERFRASQSKLNLETETSDDLAWAVTAIENDPDLGAARRQIHHYFKRVWMLRQAGVLSGPDLELLTSKNAGWLLWRDKVLPATIASGLLKPDQGEEFATADDWAPELIRWVDEANRAVRRPN